ncbi:uncharacterized protein YggT (Ycf19 family) [Salirhabdus euzebyi]|uniref:Uncharacterized protein YggT (Ycf19 family) n=1 Tax=Salirhabdus euzebyi TaxID=394506 RepID=A0A841PST3_9BACI|nr:hypothetical protein [Salirhabdus euzebyi]MBB6451869.1 uncharacterized protein YggT (Ycf19 family) [Salirhabdus euzebyi]
MKRNFFVSILQFALGAIQAILCLRFMFKIFSPVAESFLAQWLYLLSDPLIYPFDAAFPSSYISGMFFIEKATFIALIIYTLVGILVINFVNNLIYESQRKRSK